MADAVAVAWARVPSGPLSGLLSLPAAIQLCVLQPNRVQPEVSLGGGGRHPRLVPSSDPRPALSPEPEGDAADHAAEGPLHPHRRRWGSPAPQSSSAPGRVGAGGEDQRSRSGWRCWAVQGHEGHQEGVRHSSGFPASLASDARPADEAAFPLGQSCPHPEAPHPQFVVGHACSALVAKAVPACGRIRGLPAGVWPGFSLTLTRVTNTNRRREGRPRGVLSSRAARAGDSLWPEGLRPLGLGLVGSEALSRGRFLH